MFHLFFDNRPWFAAKRYGYGAGLPIAWQGWVLMLSYLGLVAGLVPSFQNGRSGPLGAAIVLFIAATAGFVAIVHRRTAGGWRWRWGDGD